MKMKKEKDSTILSGIILSFLHLRHLDLRQIQHECFKHINYLVSINRNCSKMIEVFQKDSKIGDLGWFLIHSLLEETLDFKECVGGQLL